MHIIKKETSIWTCMILLVCIFLLLGCEPTFQLRAYDWWPPRFFLRPTIITNVDPASYFSDTSITVGRDGRPVISYYDRTNHDLKFVQCGNESCSSNNTISTVDSAGYVGRHNSIAIHNDPDVGADDIVISYYDETNQNLKLTMIGSTRTRIIDFVGDVGSGSSITVGRDGLPVISYYDLTNGDLKVAKLGHGYINNVISTVDSLGYVGEFTSIAIVDKELPVISYYDMTNKALKVAKCGNTSCSPGNTTIEIVDYAILDDTSMTIGRDGMPIIAYYDETNRDLKVAKCHTSSCSQHTITTVDSTVGSIVGWHAAITIGGDGLPVISYYHGPENALKVAKCGNESCSSNNSIATVDRGSINSTSITIGKDGLPIIAYSDYTGFPGPINSLKVAKCRNKFCRNN